MIAIIDYKSGNIASIKNALKRLGIDCVVTNKVDDVYSAKGVIFPGQGRAGMAMKQLKKDGLLEAIKNIKVPFLGICLGMQLMFERSEEDEVDCLGVIQGDVRRFPIGLTVPQIGWNKVNIGDSPLFKNIPQESYFYFVNSYYCQPTQKDLVAKSEYGITFCSALKKDNFYGVQFHPEKSGRMGQEVLDNFIKLC